MLPKAPQIINSLLSTCLLLSVMFYPTKAQNPPAGSCPAASSNYTKGSPYQSNLNLTLASLASNISSNGFYNTTFGTNPNKVYGLLQCRADIPYEDCKICANNSTSLITANNYCPNKIEAVLFSEHCTLRYAGNRFFSIPSTNALFYIFITEDMPNRISFGSAVEDLVNSISTKAASDASKFSVGATAFSDSVTIFGMAQCIRDLSNVDCLTCLRESIASLRECCYGKRGGNVLSASCNVKYDLSPFFNSSLLPSSPPPASPPPPPPPPPASPPPPPASPPPSVLDSPSNKEGTSKKVLLIVILVVASVLILVITIFFMWRKVVKKRVEVFKEHISAKSEIESIESLTFDLATLRIATNHFSDSHKLGQGGFGPVYKGELPDGRKIAVKRLARHSGQGLEQLKTEVTLVAKLMHKNLVQLLGFCIQEKEKLLIYEFLPNGSLDHILYDESKRPLLDWEKRHKIILGIARGLLYLHQDSPYKIVHRDMKGSNILLDEDMNAKISDFGLARLFGDSQVEDNTNHIAGTYGYMAPEYTMHGQYSIKSDVFSFGVLVLEIVSGRKGSSFHNSMNLLSYVWHYWNGGKALDIVDPTLGNKWLPSEILKCLQLGLLCVQKEPHHRPTMTQIFLWLNSYTVTCPVPSPPAYFMDRVTTESDGTTNRTIDIEFDKYSMRSSQQSVNEVTVSDVYPR